MEYSFPFESGVYQVAPGLRMLTGHVFQLDGFARYRDAKLAARASRATYLESGLNEPTRAAAIRYVAAKLASEHPDDFALHGTVLSCRLTGETIGLDECGLDELLLQVAEDAAVFQTGADREYLAAAQISMPSSWRLEEKIGRDFAAIHEPVAGMRLDNFAELLRTLAVKGPYERFAWGLTNEDALDQYSPAHAEVLPDPLFVRVERQTTSPLPPTGAWLFTIRPSNTNANALSAAQRESLARALESMTGAQAAYKGVARTRPAIIERLRRP